MAKKRILSLLLVIVMILAMLPANAFAAIDDSDTLHQLLFLSDIHSGTYEIDKVGIPCSQFSNLKYMLSNLKAEGLHPEAVTCGGDYTRDTYGDYSDWNDLYAVVNGTIKSNFPDAKAIYTMGNHEWEAASLGSGSDKEALFEKLFGYPRCGVRMVTDDYAIYQIGAQGNNRQGVDKEIFFTQDIQALDDFLATQVGQQRVIFIQTHWPIHSGWNFNYRNITNADLMINTLNKYADDMDIVYFWGHNHYGDPMRQTVQKPGSTITYYAQQGQPSRTRSAEIKFTYVSTGCMNDMWNLQTGGFDMDPGPGVCSFVEIKKDKLVINYRHVENTLSDDPIYDDDVTFKSYRPDESVDRIDPPRIYNNPSVVEIKLQHTEFGGEKQYAIKVQNGRGGTASASATKSAPNEEIALTATPKDGYHFKQWQVIDGDVEIKDDKFIMPEAAVTVKAIFESDAVVTATTYELADEIEAGERYVIVSNGYALKAATVTDSVVAEGTSLASVPVTVEDTEITSEVSDDMTWTFAEGSSPDAPGYEGYYILANDGKMLFRGRLGGKSAANLTLNDGMPADSSINRVFWLAKDAGNDGAKSLVEIGQTSNSSDYVFFLQASSESFNAPWSERASWESTYANYPVKLYKVTETSSAPGLPSIDFTDPAEESKFEIINGTGASIAEGTGLTLTCTRPAFETCNDQNSGDQATNPADVVAVPVSGDWTATLTVDFSTGSASNGYYQFFGFYAAEGEDYQNLAGIRGGDGAMQNFTRKNGVITADSADLNSAPGFASAGTYYLRLTKEDTTYICERSNDGEEFTPMFTYADTGIEADQILIDAYTGMTEGYRFTLKALDFEGGEGGSECAHVTELKGAKEATCEEAGYTGDEVCTKCGKTVKKGKTIAALGHDWGEGKVTKPATAAETGLKSFTCARCGATKTEVIPKVVPSAGGYVLADKIEAGERYVIVSNGYAMNSLSVTDSVVVEGASLGSTAVTVEGDKITSEVAANMLWTFETGSSPDAPGYEGYYICSADGKMLYRGRLGGMSAASLSAADKPADSSLNRVFWLVKDLEGGAKSLVEIGQTSNDSDYVFFVQGSSESFNAPWSERASWESAYANYPVKLYKLTEAGGECTEHDYVEYVTEATCTEAGYITYVCSKCGDSYVEPLGGGTMPEVVTEVNVPSGLTSKRSNMTYGKVYNLTYHSSVAKRDKKVNVQVPADYDESKSYPVLYLLHGIMGSENDMVGQGTLIQNMVADGLAEEMIVVYPNMFSGTSASPSGINQAACEGYDKFSDEIVTDLMPFIRENFSVKEGKANTALAGFSMGGRETLSISLFHPDVFGYICAMSAAPGVIAGKDMFMTHPGQFKPEEVVYPAGQAPFIMMTSGDKDSVVGTFPQEYDALYTKNGIDHYWWVIPGADHGGATNSGVYNFCKYVFKTAGASEPLGHDYEAVVTAPTCTEKGYTTYTCTRCGDTYKDDEVAALGHDYKDGKCTRCGAKDPDYEDPIEPKNGFVLADKIEPGERYVIVSNGYALNSESVADSAIADGYTLGSTPVTVKDDQITSDVDDNMIWTFETGSSPDAPGYEGYYIYADDGKMLYRSRLGGMSAAALITSDMPAEASINRVFWIEKDLDNAGSMSLVQIGQISNDADYVFFLRGSSADFAAPWSERANWESSYASYPVKLYKVTGDAVCEHEYKAVKTEPTCVDEGYTTYTCSKCGKTYKGDKVAALGHAYKDEVTAPTCEAEGFTTHTCERCGNNYTDSKVPAKGHNYENGKCTECGAEDPDYEGPKACPSEAYTDAPEKGNWAHEGIDYCIANEYMNGVGGGLFNPAGNVTRAQLVTILYRVAGQPEIDESKVIDFVDVEDGLWYSDAIAWASANDIVNGVGENKFNPTGAITREQIAAIFFRYAKAEAGEGSIDAFPDCADAHEYAVPALAWAVEKGIITGVATNGVTYLRPRNNATRAQIASIIMRYLEGSYVCGE